MLPLVAGFVGAVALIALMWWSGDEVRGAWAGLRAVHERQARLTELERATWHMNREVRGFLDRPDEAGRTEVEAMKSGFTRALWRLRDDLARDDASDFADFSDAARRYLVGFDDLRGLEIDIALLYDGTFADLTTEIRARLDALDLAIRPGDVVLRPLVATAYDRFAEFRIHLVAYRRDRDLAQIDAARKARDAFQAALAEIGRSPTPDSRGYAIERFGPHLQALDTFFENLIAISWRKALWLSGYVDGNRGSMMEALARLVERSQARERATEARFETLLDGALARGAGIAVVSLAIGIVVARRVGRSLREALARLAAAMRAVVGGEHDRPIPHLGDADEIGETARALEVFRREAASLRRREEAHDAQERRWLSILETSPIAIAVISAESGRRVFHNRRWSELFPLSPDGDDGTATGNGLADHFAEPSDASRLAEAVVGGADLSARRSAMRRPDGTAWWALIEVRAIDFAGRPAHILWVYDDSDRQRAEDELRLARDRAEAALARLAQARDDLVEAEKLATIGGLVAGVAHEVNNPVGIGLTVASTLARRTAAFADELAAGALRRSRLDEFVAGVGDASAQLVANLGRAADLVQSFKQVAVDRTHPDRRAYDLADATEQIVASLRPRLKTTPHRFEIDVAEGLRMDGYPGAWGQVVTNLFLNALTHAFREGVSGVVRLTARPEGEDRVAITFADDGRGMGEDEARRAFEPFFTTRREAGGSGLGLHIVRNIVVRRLGGRIGMTSEPGRGTRFEMSLPRVAPDDVAARDPRAVSEPGR